MFFVFKQKTAYEMRISDWSSDVCSSDLSSSGPRSSAASPVTSRTIASVPSPSRKRRPEVRPPERSAAMLARGAVSVMSAADRHDEDDCKAFTRATNVNSTSRTYKNSMSNDNDANIAARRPGATRHFNKQIRQNPASPGGHGTTAQHAERKENGGNRE